MLLIKSKFECAFFFLVQITYKMLDGKIFSNAQEIFQRHVGERAQFLFLARLDLKTASNLFLAPEIELFLRQINIAFLAFHNSFLVFYRTNVYIFVMNGYTLACNIWRVWGEFRWIGRDTCQTSNDPIQSHGGGRQSLT